MAVEGFEELDRVVDDLKATPEEDSPEKPEVKEEPKEEIKEEPKEEPKEEIKPPEPEDNKERSQLGRKVKLQETKIGELEAKIQQLLQSKEEPEPEDDYIPTTKEELESFLEQRESRKEEEAKKYQTTFQTKIVELGLDLSDEEFDETFKYAQSNYKKMHTDPEIDAQLNWYAAQNTLLRTAKTTPANPLKGENPEGPLGGESTKTINNERKATVPKLSPIAKEFANSMGLSDEKISEALKDDIPLGTFKGIPK